MKKFFVLLCATALVQLTGLAQDPTPTPTPAPTPAQPTSGPDITPPVITIESPVAGAIVPRRNITVFGRVTDNVAVRSVHYRGTGQSEWRRALISEQDGQDVFFIFSFRATRRPFQIEVVSRDIAGNQSDRIIRTLR
ncbi:MAG: Ig-like domain-containing protein [Verrucomicrobiales bacterium]